MKIEIKKMHLCTDPHIKTKAAADITLGGLITVYGCSVVAKNDGGMFVSMPQKKDKNKEKYWSIVYIEDKALMEAIQAAVLAEYKKKAGIQEGGSGPESIPWEE